MSVETPPSEPGPAEQPAQRRCPRCGAGMTDRQEWCLSCGAAVGTRVVSAPGWRTPLAVAGVILLLAAIALAIAIVQLADDTDQVAQNPQPTATAAPPPPTPTPTPTPTTTPTPEATATPQGTGSADATWPAGETGWTVVLASDPTEDGAREKATKFAAGGIAGVGVLDADEFRSLKNDMWLVFAGTYDTQAEAAAALDGIDEKDAYIRRIAPA